MLDLILNGGVQCFTLLAFVLAAVLVVLAWRRRAQPVEEVSTSWFVLAFLALGVLLNLSYGLYRGYVAPRDVLQDIVSAQECLAGRSLYPEGMNEKMRAAMADSPRASPFGWSESLRERERATREQVFKDHWVQAHPPPMTLLFVPLVACLGVLGTQIAYLVLSVAALVASVWLILRELQITLNRRQLVMLALALMGADPFVDVLRLGQSGLILELLLVLGWVCLRRGRPGWAGVWIGLATGLKLYPGLLLVYLAVRHPRALLTALLTLAGLAVLVGTCTGWHTFVEFYQTARGVSHEYEDYAANVSLLGFLSRFGGPDDAVVSPARVAFVVLAIVLMWGVVVAARRESLDVGYGLCLALMPVLSPISWDHYLVVLLLPLFLLGRKALVHGDGSYALSPGTLGERVGERGGGFFAHADPLSPVPSPPEYPGGGGQEKTRWGQTLGFLAILIALAIPETTFTFVYGHLHESWSLFLDKVLGLPLRTYAVFAVIGWLGWPVWAVWLQAGRARLRWAWPLLVLLGLLAAAHLWAYVPSEPWFNNDETRHVMTGVFVRDAFVDQPAEPREYAVHYYLQYPALGLLVWPPLFYGIEGAYMLVAGTSYPAAKVLVWLFAAWACVSLYGLVTRTHDRTTAFLAAFLMGLSPLVFEFSHQVMLEVPTLAFALFAVERCQRYLAEARRLDLLLCCLGTAGAALCRYDGIYLLPLYLIWLVGARQLAVLRRPTVLFAVVAAVALVAPAYLLCAHEMGGAHLQAVREGTSPESTSFFNPWNFVFYIACVPEQMSWFAVPPLVLGLVGSLRRGERATCWPYFAMVLATYLTFAPIAELASRHTIYWVPGLAFFAARGLRLLMAWLKGWPGLAVCALLLLGTLATTLSQPVYYVRGYDEAAAYVVANNDETPSCLMDGFLNGDFIYQARRHDPGRRLTVRRGDKDLYAVLSDPKAGYQQYADTEDEVLALLHRYDPEYIVIERPQILFNMRAPEMLAAVLGDGTKPYEAEANGGVGWGSAEVTVRKRFVLERVVEIDSNHRNFAGKKLLIYHNTVRNTKRDSSVRVPVLGMGRDLE